MVFLSRHIAGRERLRFEKTRNQKILVEMFNNLLKVFHDGIIISGDEKILYRNEKIFDIFNIKSQVFRDMINK